MFAESLAHSDDCSPSELDDSSPPCNQLMVTASPILCSAISRSYENMRSTHLASMKNPSLAQERSKKRDESKQLLNFVQCSTSDFPMIITFSKFLKMLDNSLSVSFDSTKSDPMDDEEGDDDEDMDDTAEETYPVAKANCRHEVDYDRFVNHYFPRFDSHIAFDVDQIYIEIMSFIKGSLQALHTKRGYLSLSQYLHLSEGRNSTLTIEQREVVYQAFEKYEKIKNTYYRDFDMLDVVFFVYSSLSKTPYAGIPMTSVYIDEVQDLTPAQLALFQFVCPNLKGFVFAGDTAQTVSRISFCVLVNIYINFII